MESKNTSYSAPQSAYDASRSKQDHFNLPREQLREDSVVDHDGLEANVDPQHEKDVILDGGYGWVVVACVFGINGHTWGLNTVCVKDSRFAYLSDVVIVIWSLPGSLPVDRPFPRRHQTSLRICRRTVYFPSAYDIANCYLDH
jgi:hypothetical protein